MKKVILLVCIIQMSWAVGFQALQFPQNARMLATSSAGIGGANGPVVNPASIYAMNNRSLSFSWNNWLGDIRGTNFGIGWNVNNPQMFTLQTWNLEDIELWGDSPGAKPLGVFETHWVAGSYTRGFNVKGWQTGATVRASYSRLYTESSSGFTVDFGSIHAVTNDLSVGAVIKNAGFISGDMKMSLPLTLGAGAVYEMTKLNSSIAADVIWDDEHGMGFNGSAAVGWKYFSLLGGTLLSADQQRFSTGFNFDYRRYSVTGGVAFHDSSSLGIPWSLDVAVRF